MPKYLVRLLVPLSSLIEASTGSPTDPSKTLAERDVLGPVCDVSTGWPTSFDCWEAFRSFNEFFSGYDVDDPLFGEIKSSGSFGLGRHELITPLGFVGGYCAITVFNLPNSMIQETERNATLKSSAASIINTCVESGGTGTGGYIRNLGLLGNLAIWVYSQWLPSGDFATLSPTINPRTHRIGYTWRALQHNSLRIGPPIYGPQKPSQCFAKGRLDVENITPDWAIQNAKVGGDIAEVGDDRAGYCKVGKGDGECCKGYKCTGKRVVDEVRNFLLLGTRKVLEVGVCLFDQGVFDQAVKGS